MSEFAIELFGERMAIRRDDRQEISEGGLVLPPNAQTRSMTGTVVAVGSGIKKADGTYTEMPVKVGDIVVFEQFRHMIEVLVEGELFHVLNLSDVLGKARGAVKIHGKD